MSRARSIRARVLATAVLVLMGAAACTSSDGGGQVSSTTSGDAEIAARGVLRVALDDPGSLDPAEADPGEPTSMMVADLLFDGLTALSTETLEPVPGLAEWTVDDDLELWTFTLSPAARFSDGSRVTATDVVFTLERIAAVGAAGTASVQLEPVEGYEELAVEGTATGLAGVTAIDDSTVQIALSEPLSTLPALLASPVFGVVPKMVVESDPEGFARAPTGSGPVRVDARDGDQLRLVPASDTAESGEWSLGAIDLTLTEGLDEALELFGSGDVDLARVPNDQLERASRSGTVLLAPYPAELFYAFNLDDPVLRDRDLRAAAVAAIDRRALVDEVYGSGVALLDGLVPEGVPGGGRDACGEPCDHSPEQAAAVVAAAGSPAVTVDHDAGAPQDEIARIIGDDLRAAGFEVEVRSHPFDADDPEGYQALLARGEQGIFRLGWLGAYPSPEVFLSPLFDSASPDNVLGFSDPEVDDLLEEARRTRDTEARRELYAQAEDLILAAVPVIPIAQFNANLLVAEGVSGVVVTPTGSLDLSRASVTEG